MPNVNMEKPADFTFMHFGMLREAKPENVQTVRVGAPSRGPHNKLATRAVWLGNNRLKSFKYLDIFINSILEEPLNLTWLDLSFNKLTEVDNSILRFPYLRILYLHGNKISDPKEIVKLKALPELRALTIHGNPVYSKKQYRQYMISVLPQLVSLDFTRITAPERDYATAVRHDIEA